MMFEPIVVLCKYVTAATPKRRFCKRPTTTEGWARLSALASFTSAGSLDGDGALSSRERKRNKRSRADIASLEDAIVWKGMKSQSTTRTKEATIETFARVSLRRGTVKAHPTEMCSTRHPHGHCTHGSISSQPRTFIKLITSCLQSCHEG